MTDPIADFLTRLRNAARARKTEFTVPYSKLKSEIARILEKEGYIAGFELETTGRRAIRISRSRTSSSTRPRAITGLKRVSKPGLRRYVGADEVPARPRRHGHRGPFHLPGSAHRARSTEAKRWRRTARLRLVRNTSMSRIGKKPIEVPAKVKVNVGAEGARHR